MNISQKCQYALRAIFELAMRQGDKPIRIAEIAEAQAIPARFLEVILGELKHGGFVESKRGMRGGYLLSKSAKELTAGEIIEFVDGPLLPVNCIGNNPTTKCQLQTNCAFKEMWTQAYDAVSAVYNSTTFAKLVENYKAMEGKNIADYCI